MAQITVKTSKEHRFNKGIRIAGYNIKFDEYCMAEIPDRYVEAILKADSSISLVDEVDLKKYADLKEKLAKSKEDEKSPSVDFVDEIGKLKVKNAELIEKNKKLVSDLDEANKTIDELNQTIEGLDTNPKPENKNVEETVEDTADETAKEAEDVGVQIDDMKKSELQDLCRELEITEDEWINLKVDDLRSFVKTQIEKTDE